MQNRLSVENYVEGILSGNRSMLGRAITLIESQLVSDKALAQQVLDCILPHTGQSVRIGITGVPGVGKSTFIETFGKYITDQQKKLAVLAIDPTSQRSKGSIMGDKTRMEALAHNPLAFIRPSPAGGSLGGVTHRTRETILLCEAAGYDVIFVETVGVGQSETVVKNMVDFFLLLMLAGAGDELQGIKKGIMEMADAVVITKADGDNINAANRAVLEYQNALHLFSTNTNNWYPTVCTCSALENRGFTKLWDIIDQYVSQTKSNDFFGKNRQSQQLDWLHSYIKQTLENRFYENNKQQIAKMEQAILDNQILPIQAALTLLSDRL